MGLFRTALQRELWVDADPFIRYSRISESQRGRVDDTKSFHEFLEEEEHDMNPGDISDPASVNMSAVRDIADLTVDNNFKTQDEYVSHLIKRFEFSESPV